MFDISPEDGLAFDLQYNRQYPLDRIDPDTVAFTDAWGCDWFAVRSNDGTWHVQMQTVDSIEVAVAA